MSRILHHVGRNDFKKTRQRQIGEQKELAAQKLKEWQEAEVERKQIEEAARRYKSNWRDELVVPVAEEVVVEVQEPKVNKILKVNREKGGVVSDEFIQRVVSEGMTTSGMFQTTLNPEGDVDLVPTTDNVVDSNFTTNLNWSASNGVATSADDPNRIIPGATSTVWRRADMKIPIPADKNISTVKITVSKGGGTLNWTDRDPGENFDADLYLSVSGGTYQSINSVESGVYTFTVDPKGSPYAPGYVFVNFGQFAKINATGQSTVQVSFQRRTPVNVFVSLDSPEATAFIRTDPIMRGLSAAERYKKLEDLLDSGDEYALKALGMQTSGTRPADTGNVKSWDQAANEVDYGTDLTPLSDNPYGTELGQIAMAGDMDMGGLGLLGMGLEGLAAIASLGVAGLMATYNMSQEMATWLVNKYGGSDWGAAPGYDKVGDWNKNQDLGKTLTPQQQAEVEAAGNELRDAQRALNDLPSDATDAQRDMAQERLDRASKNRQRLRKKHREENKNRKESFEVNGEVLTEKKKLKSPKDVIANKIPGYYDGKPAPLGFPMEPPAKMVNGFHADLVTPEGQEKQSNRYNRMDQATANAMPMTDNPYINKKILKARKQPK